MSMTGHDAMVAAARPDGAGPPAWGAFAAARRDAMKRPSSTASAMMRLINVPARMASSLPGITYWITSGSQLVSTTATIGRPSLLASVTPMCSFLVSMMNTASGSRFMLRIPPRLRSSLSSSRDRMSASFFGMASKSPAARIRSYSCIFFTRPEMVVKFVNMPPSHRSFTYGMPHCWA